MRVRAAMRLSHVDDEAELALELAGMAKLLRQLPRAGGLLDQDGYHMFLIRTALVAMNEKEEAELKKHKPPRTAGRRRR